MLIDEWMPAWDAVERHETRIRAPREAVWRTVRTLDFARSPIIAALFALRSLPGLLSRRPRKKALGTTLDGLLRNGFVLMGERPGEELLLGVAGRFWRPTGDIVRLATETRVRCTDPASRRSFLRYWTVVGPFSGLIRREMLRSIRRAAESAVADPQRIA